MKSDMKKVFGGLVSAYWYVPDPVTQLHGTGEELNLLIALLESGGTLDNKPLLRERIAELEQQYQDALRMFNPVAVAGHKESLVLLHRIRQKILIIALCENVIDIESVRSPMFGAGFSGTSEEGAR